MNQRAALIVATMDTKGKEVEYIHARLGELGVPVLILDAGIIGESPFPITVGRKETAEAGGLSLDEVRSLRDEGKAIATMTTGATLIAKGLYEQGRIGGIISVGGSMGTTLGTGVMRAFPVGFPKIMISTMASGNTRPYVGTRDIMMVFSICDLSGINRVTGRVLRNAANALAGLLRDETGYIPETNRVIALSTLGTTEVCSQRIRTAFEEKGYEVLVFHTTGAGGEAMEEIIREENVTGVIDLSLDEIGNHEFGGDYDAGSNRGIGGLEKGIPTVVVPGNIDILGGGPLRMAQVRFPGRRFHVHNPAITAVRTTKKEIGAIAEIIARCCNQARGPVSCIVPAGGFSLWDQLGGPFYDPEASEFFIQVLKEKLSDTVPLQVLPYNINIPAFAETVITCMEQLLQTNAEAAH
jgi:uncharacterized protein (UPF0261 family)